ncbi:hypothetical protein MDAP_001924 [Mitosporidium daphniae]|uniref:Uncharacterized protein n=1 Tax=Mitosporidium daphniae TaxID=1485682 RepID=A0A098VVR8_9MICR|nr:uncharacterized protein DI09_122p20 [Mitosporidium daphniae]KGG52934.1 hypothetical protein DI09_122p20 [Mitosporidium daphniae]|eukprot:XP_013239370.1 uncharacterized protein DI09_122p20 [Mitosporidium daphniae]
MIFSNPKLTPYVSHLTPKAPPGNKNTLSPADFFSGSDPDVSPPIEAIKAIRKIKAPNLLCRVIAKMAQNEKHSIYQGFSKDTTLLDTYLSNQDLEAIGVDDMTLTRKPYTRKKLK